MNRETIGYLKESLKARILSGYDTPNRVLEQLGDALADESPFESPAEAKAGTAKLRAWVRDLFARRDAAEEKWKGPTTNDRITAAFAALGKAGIVALEDAGYTMSDGWSDYAEVAATLKVKPRGGTFFHGQDVERAVLGEGLFLAFGASSGKDEDSVEIGREICAVLAAHGVRTRWDGTVQTRIQIEPFRWRKRRVTKSPPVTVAGRKAARGG